MRKFCCLIFLILFLVGCSPTATTKSVITDNHAISKVLSNRIDGSDAIKPTKDELEQYVKSSAKAWESLDREVNGYGK